MPDQPTPDHLIPEPESSKSAMSGHESSPDEAISSASSSVSESDLAGLAALFTAQAGGGLPAQLSADLALEIVLNEIVEQACLVTGASGAAVALLRDGEMVCRASTGDNAPELGARLGSESGLTAECVKTKQVQRCDDAQADPRADIEASRNLGVRSVMILPLLRAGDLLGILEVFSSRRGVFQERDEVTLEALAHRILKNLEQAGAPIPGATQNPERTQALPSSPVDRRNSPIDSAPSPKEEPEEENRMMPEVLGRNTRRRFDVATFAMVAAIVVCAILLGTLLGAGLGWRKSIAARGRAPKSVLSAAQNEGAQTIAVRTGAGALGGATPEANSVSASSTASNPVTPTAKDTGTLPIVGATNSPVPPGTLLVYEKGKEIFRLPPSVEDRAKSQTGKKWWSAQSEVKPASTLQTAATIVELSPEAAEGNLAYRVEPEYPEQAREQRIQGPVVLDVHIARDGGTQEVKVVSGDPVLADAAIAAVKQWRFKPHTLNGQPVEMQTRVILNFRLPT